MLFYSIFGAPKPGTCLFRLIIAGGGGGGGDKKVSIFLKGGEFFVYFSWGGGRVRKLSNLYFPHLPTPLPINNDHPLRPDDSTWYR